MTGIPGRLHHRPGLRREALSESGAGATLWKCCVSADTYGTGAGESERVMRCEAAAELPGGSSGRGCGRAGKVRVDLREAFSARSGRFLFASFWCMIKNIIVTQKKKA